MIRPIRKMTLSQSQAFDAVPGSARAVRRFLEECLVEVGEVDDIVLAASELATNVIRHARTEYTVRLDLDDNGVRLEVSDGSSIIPAIEDLAHHQRGLRVIEGVTDRWGVESTDTGKTVWAELRARRVG